MADYLKDEQYYIDRYDLLTIEECLRWEKGFLEQKIPEFEGRKITLKKEKALKGSMAEFALYFVKGGRHKSKSARIQEWMNEDRIRQEKYDNASTPSYVRCQKCNGVMEVTSKDLWDFTDKPLRVLFFYDCTDCKSTKAYYDDGEEYKPKPHLCPKCSGELVRSHTKESSNKFTTTEKCKFCDYSETEVFDFEKSRKENEEREKSERFLLAKYRSEFCMSDKEGQEYLSLELGMGRMNEIMEKQKEREIHKDLYDKVAKLKKLTIVELEKLLIEALEKEGYIKFDLSNPEMGQFVSVEFHTRDAKQGRSEYESTNGLKKLINRTLMDTNWRLMSEGIHYRVGFLQGRLRVYEKEEDMVKLFGKLKDSPNQNSIDF